MSTRVFPDPKQDEIDRLRAELATHCACVFESTSQEGGCDLVEQCKFHASEEENLVRPLRAEIERLTAEGRVSREDVIGLQETNDRLIRELYKCKNTRSDLEAEVERLKVERDGYSWAAKDLADALRHTQEYVGPETLPAIPGWSWFDALMRYEQIDGARKAGEER